jgi:hypothetical protein
MKVGQKVRTVLGSVWRSEKITFYGLILSIPDTAFPIQKLFIRTMVVYLTIKILFVNHRM